MSGSRRLPPRLLRRLVLSGVLGLALGVAAWSLGMDLPHAVGLAAAAAAFVACLSTLGETADPTWAAPALEPRPGARRDIVQLGWSFGSRGGRVSPEGMRRLRLVAESALAAQGRDLHDRTADAELQRLLGADVLAALRRGATEAPPRLAFVGVVLQRLEALDADGPAAPPGASGGARPAPPGGASSDAPPALGGASTVPPAAPRGAPAIPPAHDAPEEPHRAR
ncbi:hypothetical protein DOE76_10515 [Leifsonia sp. ku-ls]|nr:hypothetical protein DOE76_10515 [Leifsonia sp. ku-ls]